jgi:putative CocE/NonD family hydrolase
LSTIFFVTCPGTLRSWIDYALKDVANEFATRPPVRIFVMGENARRDETEFPPARARTTRYYLQAGPAREEGVLAQTPRGVGSRSYDYDPEDPAPTLGGRLCGGNVIPPGPADQRSLGSRPDVLVFSTPPLARPVEVTGWLSLELFASPRPRIPTSPPCSPTWTRRATAAS